MYFCTATPAVLRCLAQLAVAPEGREALRQNPSVRDALQLVAEAGLCEHARRYAESALLALSENELHATTEGQSHVMLSCESLRVANTAGWTAVGTGAGPVWAGMELTRACALQTNGMYSPQSSASTSC